jgi:hypothetical protein
MIPGATGDNARPASHGLTAGPGHRTVNRLTSVRVDLAMSGHRPPSPPMCGRGENHEQAHLPAQQPSPIQGARFPLAHAHSCWPCHSCRSSPQGPHRALGLRPGCSPGPIGSPTRTNSAPRCEKVVAPPSSTQWFTACEPTPQTGLGSGSSSRKRSEERSCATGFAAASSRFARIRSVLSRPPTRS